MERPCGIFDENYPDTIAIARTPLQKGLLSGVTLFLFFGLPFIVQSDYRLDFINSLCIILVAVYGLQILTGLCGQISLGHAAFMGVGAYIYGILYGILNIPFPLSLIGAAFFTGVYGVIFGLPATRLKGFYLAITTLAAHFITVWLFIHLRLITGGTDGMLIPQARIGVFRFETEMQIYFLVMAIALLLTFFVKNTIRTKAGRAFIAIRDKDIAAEIQGINITHYKLLAFFISSMFAGLAGSLLAIHRGFIHPEHFLLMDSIIYLGMIIIGGMGSTVGTIFGVLFVEVINRMLAFFTPLLIGVAGSSLAAAAPQLIFGIILMSFLIFEPHGLTHIWDNIKNFYRRWPFSY